MKLRFSPIIVDDLERAIAYYEGVSISVANRFRDEVGVVFKWIRQNPNAAAVFYRDVRFALVGKFPYAVYYRNDNGCAILIGIIHTATDPATTKQRMAE